MTQARTLGNIGDAISGPSNTNISFDSGTLFIDSTNNKIGINKSPTQDFDILGDVNVSNYITGNVSTTTITTPTISNPSTITLESDNGANSISILANGTFALSAGIQFPDGTLQTTKASGGGLNSSIVQYVTATANTTIDLSLGDVVKINVATDIVNLSFTNAGEKDIVYVVLNFDANTRTISNIANCTSSVAFGAKDNPFIFRLTTQDYGNNWIYTSQGGVVDTGRKSLWSWGANDYGQLGQNDITHRSSPVQVGSLTNWSEVCVGAYHSILLKSDGTLWSCGRGSYGELGYYAGSAVRSPTQVGSLTDWTLISCGAYFSTAIKTDGTLWSWGANYTGELGHSNTTSRSSPTRVGSLTNWSKVSSQSGHSLAIKTDGTLWSWGNNGDGQLGLNDRTHRSSPTQVGSLTTWSLVAGGRYHSLAIKTDGTLWSWGRNSYGIYLGLNDITHRSSPTQVGSLTTWSQVAGGGAHSLALKTDGTLWAWGWNPYGQLGLNDRTSRSSPTQVGTLTTWSLVSGGNSHSLALKADGTLWSWGYNPDGQLGQNDRTNRSSPTQVGSLTTWSNIMKKSYYSGTITLQ